MSETKNKRMGRMGFVLICLLILIELGFVFYQTNLFAPFSLNRRHKLKRSLTNVNQIQPWMTFDYLNVVFSLPPDFFHNAFKISDPQYPNMQINQLAKSRQIYNQELIEEIKALLIARNKQ